MNRIDLCRDCFHLMPDWEILGMHYVSWATTGYSDKNKPDTCSVCLLPDSGWFRLEGMGYLPMMGSL